MAHTWNEDEYDLVPCIEADLYYNINREKIDNLILKFQQENPYFILKDFDEYVSHEEINRDINMNMKSWDLVQKNERYEND